ncbi:hypothetical protein FT641_18180 [Bacillus paranthracis]|uniref:hypothetical protein n=1 Tax=Bacillus paranthracis TaxID=2026186 RepID=UPI001879C89C|nr:hypothetical protein [Bacillus paranthracis]MBE7114509.1 hypothetical protein [Bacillus paranthracis]MBE7154617.1 hypothetical protein [Bacillus paranthracis]
MSIEQMCTYLTICFVGTSGVALVMWFVVFVLRTKFGSKKELTNTDYDRMIKYMDKHKVKECGVNFTDDELQLHNKDIGVTRKVARKSLFGTYTEEYTKVKGLIK